MSEEEFIDAESHSFDSKTKTSFKDIVIRQLERCTKKYSVEFRGGYEQKRSKIVGNVEIIEKFYIPDTREEFCNSIICLSDLLHKEYNKKFLSLEEKYRNEIIESTEKTKKLIAAMNLFRMITTFLDGGSYFQNKIYTDE